MSVQTSASRQSESACSMISELIRGGAFVNGEHVSVNDPLKVYEVESGDLLGQVENVSASLVREATLIARQSLRLRWEPWHRQRVLNETASRLEAIAGPAADLIAAEGIKTIAEAKEEVTRAVQTMRLSANAIEHFGGETLSLDADKRGAGRSGYFSRIPLGVIAAITPFNDPLNLVAHKVGPALAAGNAVVVKPAEQTPFSALLLAQLLHDSGAPAGIISVLPGDAATGQALVEDSNIDAISFTGGGEVGARISSLARGRKVMLELGGNNAVVVAADSDLAHAVESCVAGAFGAAGQNCLSVQRVYVQREIAESFTEMVIDRTEELSVGTKSDPRTDVGPMVSDSAVKKYMHRVGEAVKGGAQLRTGGDCHDRFVQPTVLTSIDEESTLFTEECFAPVMCIVPYDDWTTLPQRIAAAGQPMQAGVFSSDFELCMTLADGINAGAVLINDSSDFRIDAMPFGGFGTSGIGREGVKFAMHELSAPKSIIFPAVRR